MSRSFIIIPSFEIEQKLTSFFFSSHSVFLNTKTYVVTNLKPLNSDNNFTILLLIAEPLSLSCSLGLKEFKIST